MIGKTNASINFVKEAEHIVDLLKEKINLVKDGTAVLYEYVSIDPAEINNWEEALKLKPIGVVADSFYMNYVDGNMWGCGIGKEDGEDVIVAYVVDISKIQFPEEYEGFRVVAKKCDRPVPLEVK